MASNHPEPRSPASVASTPDSTLEALLTSADPSDDEAISLINALAEELGLDAKTAPPRAPGQKRPTQ
jgi:hypothetical protein